MFIIENICKEYPGVKALDGVSFEIQKGEVHAIVGENGAGKSTLMKIIMGIEKSDSGRLLIDDQEMDIHHPDEALKMGIAMIFQEIILVPTISVAENIYIGHLPKKKNRISIDWKKLYSDSQLILDKIDLKLDPKSSVRKLTAGQKQLVQLAKTIISIPKIIIMDEPTASLSGEETEVLFALIKELKKNGVSIIYISHRLEEIFKVADRVTVLRDGKYISTLPVSEVTQNDLIALMVGRYIDLLHKPKKHKIGASVLNVRNLTKKGLFEGINLDLKEGQIIGLYGLVGAGRTELAHALFGVYPHIDGECYIEGKSIKISSPRHAIKSGIIYLPEERKEQSIIPMMNIRENITISNLISYSRFGIPLLSKELKISNYYKEKMNIKTPSLKQKILYLSGGNQQKVTIARLMALKPKIMILDEPTRGIDVGAKTEIYSIIEELAKEGMGIVVISSDLPEVMAISDDIITMAYGRITGEFTNSNDLTQEDLLQAACIEDGCEYI